MAFLGKVIDESNSKAEEYELVKPGWYKAKIVETEIKESTRSDWKGLSIRYNLENGRVIYSSITVAMPSKPNVEEIGERQLGTLRVACGIAALQDTDQLIGKEIEIKVTINQAKGEFPESNGVNGWKALKGSEAPKVSSDAPDIF